LLLPLFAHACGIHSSPPPPHSALLGKPGLQLLLLLLLLQVTITFEAGFEPTTLAHPDTYINKVVVGSADGRLQLWNFLTASLVHTFKGW